MLVAAINRCLAPTSKLQMPAWLRSTPLLRWFGLVRPTVLRPALLGQHGTLGKKQIAAISEALSSALDSELCHLDCEQLWSSIAPTSIPSSIRKTPANCPSEVMPKANGPICASWVWLCW